MYGQRDLQGKVVSFFMRIVVLAGRVIALAFETVFYVIGLLLWMAAPVAFTLLFLTSAVQGLFFEQVGNLIR